MKITIKELKKMIREVLDEATTGGAIGGKKIGGGKPGATPIAQAVSSPSKGGSIPTTTKGKKGKKGKKNKDDDDVKSSRYYGDDLGIDDW